MKLLHGLTKESSNDAIKKVVFDKIAEIRWMSFATVGLDGLPSNRIFDFTMLKDGNLYFITAIGKPVFGELEKQPIGMVTAFFGHWLMLKVRIRVEQTDDSALWEEFYEHNPGTKALYIDSPDTLKLFRFTEGEGELLHLFEDDAMARLKFAWGNMKPRPAKFSIGDKCTSCGICADVCTTGAIRSGEPFVIDDFNCLDCGSCAKACPEEAIFSVR